MALTSKTLSGTNRGTNTSEAARNWMVLLAAVTVEAAEQGE